MYEDEDEDDGYIWPRQNIIEWNEEPYETGVGSDMTIRLSDGTELPGHRDILSYASPFFKNALKPGRFKESFTGVVHLPNDPPEAVKALIRFLYIYWYLPPPGLDVEDEVFFHIDMLDIAKIYLNDELYKAAEQKLAWLIGDHPKEFDISIVFELLEMLEIGSYGYGGLICACGFRTEELIEDEVWNKLCEQWPDFIRGLTEECEFQWRWSCHSSGKLLDHLGGEHSVGLVRREVKCPKCWRTQRKSMGLVRPGCLTCDDGDCKWCCRSNEWWDMTERNERYKKKERKRMRKAKKQHKKNKARKKSANKKLARK